MADDLIERHIRALTEIVRAPNAEHVADAHNEAVRYLREHAAALRAKDEEIARLRTVMIAAAEEIHAHWDAHCDAEGYGPANLMRRLEEGIPSEYGYTAGAFAQLRADAERYQWLQEHTVATGLSRWMGEHQFLSDAIDAAIRALKGPSNE